MKARPRPTVATSLVALLFAVPAVTAEDAATAGDGRYIVKFRDSVPGDRSERVAQAGGRIARVLPSQARLLAVYLDEKALRILRARPDVESIEVDQRRYPMAQSAPYGIGLVQADDPVLATSAASAGSTVCIIDSGFYQAHEDLQDANVTGTNDAGTGNWHEDSCGHGTHVAGTVAALDNAVGVVGVNRNGLLQLHVEKVFDGASCGWSYSSDLIAALGRCQAAVAGTGQKLVVNMSLGGTAASAAEEGAFQAAYDAGALSFASAGNGGSTATSYPAGYASVISVAAVNSAGTAASFSQRNADVELAAPGVGVVSTTPFNPTRLESGESTWFGANITGSARVDAAGTLTDGGLCSTVGSWSGNVVICRRGSISFSQKVANVVAGGGVGAVIYNNVAGTFSGTLAGTSPVPAVAFSQADGEAILAAGSVPASLVNSGGSGNGYEAYDGTSMAAPHASGVAALLWSLYPGKTNAEIREALQVTALDKGTAGRDSTYGYGIVQAKAAYDRLGGIVPPPPPPPPPADISLTVTKVKSGGKRYARLNWSGATGAKVNYYRNATKYKTPNDGVQRNGPLALGTYTYKVCLLNSSTCSNAVTITW